jgi:uncharacterized protein (TIRG00374 family)
VKINLRKNLPNIFRIGVSLILIIWLVRLAGTAQLAQSLAGAEIFFIGLILITANLDRILMAYKWNLLLRSRGIRLPLWEVIGAYYKASFWGSLFLPTIGVDAVRSFEVIRKTKRPEDTVSSVIVERALGLIATALVSLFGLYLFVEYIDPNGQGNLYRLLLFLSCIVLLFLLSFRLNWVAARIGQFPWLGNCLGEKFTGFLTSYHEFSRNRQVLLIFLFWSILEQFSPVIDTYLVSRALHMHIPWITFVMFMPVIMMVIRLPISFDGFGVREGLAVYLFGLAGVPQAQAFLLGFIPSIIARIAVAPLTLYFFLSSKDTRNIVETEGQNISL